MINKILKIFLAIIAFGAVASLTGCKYAMLDPKGLIAAKEINLLVTATLLMLLVVIPVIFMALYFSWRYRASNTRATYAPEWSDNVLIELICWGASCAIIIIIATYTWFSSHDLDPYKPLDSDKKPITIQVVALDWKWLFIYPEQNIAAVNFVQFPVDVPVQFLITSEGPMNSILIPQLAGQIYAMAGMQTKLNLVANAPGDYQGISANFSGRGFADMKFVARATTQEQFNAWVAEAKQSSLVLTADEYTKLSQPSENNPVQIYSSVEKDIFQTVVMKAMMPMEEVKRLCSTKKLTSTDK